MTQEKRGRCLGLLQWEEVVALWRNGYGDSPLPALCRGVCQEVSTATWVTAWEEVVGSRREGLGTWQSLRLLLVAPPSWRLAGVSRRCRLGQARCQYSLVSRYAAVSPQLMTFLESRQQMLKRVGSRVPCAQGGAQGGQCASFFAPQILLADWAFQEERKQLH